MTFFQYKYVKYGVLFCVAITFNSEGHPKAVPQELETSNLVGPKNFATRKNDRDWEREKPVGSSIKDYYRLKTNNRSNNESKYGNSNVINFNEGLGNTDYALGSSWY